MPVWLLCSFLPIYYTSLIGRFLSLFWYGVKYLLENSCISDCWAYISFNNKPFVQNKSSCLWYWVHYGRCIHALFSRGDIVCYVTTLYVVNLGKDSTYL